MTRGVVGDLLGNLTGKLGDEFGPLGFVNAHQVLGGVVGVRSNEFGVGAADVVDVVLFQDVATRRLRDNDVVALTDRARKSLHVVGGNLLELLDITAVQVRRATT